MPFWEIMLQFRAYKETRDRESIILAHRTAALMRTKHWPRLENLLMSDEEKRDRDDRSRAWVRGLIESQNIRILQKGDKVVKKKQ